MSNTLEWVKVKQKVRELLLDGWKLTLTRMSDCSLYYEGFDDIGRPVHVADRFDAPNYMNNGVYIQYRN